MRAALAPAALCAHNAPSLPQILKGGDLLIEIWTGSPLD